MYESGAMSDATWGDVLGETLGMLLLILAGIAVFFLILHILRRKKKPLSGTTEYRTEAKTKEKRPKSSAWSLNSGEKETVAGFRVPEEESDSGAESPPGNVPSGSTERENTGDAAEKIRGSSTERSAGSAGTASQKKTNSGKRLKKETVVFYQFEGGNLRKIPCPHCGMENEPGERNCSLCGARQEKGA